MIRSFLNEFLICVVTAYIMQEVSVSCFSENLTTAPDCSGIADGKRSRTSRLTNVTPVRVN